MDTILQKAHFMRRASFGATIAEIQNGIKPNDLLRNWLATNPSIQVPEIGGMPKGKERQQQANKLGDWLITQLITAPNPLHERITNFWRDHFTVSMRQVQFPQLISDYEKRLRTNALGDFQELLWSVTTSPAMLRYLNNGQNRVGRINENYSREVMELFTLGRGNYTEKDIQEGARALTGWVNLPNNQTGKLSSIFALRRHDRGIKSYLGKQGNLKTEDVVEILANHPSTAKTIVTKLWTTFAYANPEPKIVQSLANTYTKSQRNIAKVVEAIFTSPEFYSTKAYRSHLKSPIYFMVGTLRQLEIKADYGKVLQSLRSLGQIPYNAPTVKGWTEDAGWLTAPSLLSRITLAKQLTKDYSEDSGFGYNAQLSANELFTLLLDGQPDSVLRTAANGLSMRELTALILSSPTYQLA
jgi:uncharacterized protein (DUF1800 family)